MIPARTVSLAGDALAMIALILRVHSQGGGTAGIALLMIAFALPTVLAMGVAGHIADRFDSRPVLLISTAVQMLACAGLASFENRWSTYAFVVLLQCGQAVANPTWGALTPRIVGDEDMGRVLALQQSLVAVTGILGAAMAGVLVGTHGTSTALWVDFATFGAVLLAAGLVRTRRGGRHEASERYAVPVAASREVASPRTLDGLRILKRDRLVWLIFSWTIPFIIVLEGVNVVEVFLVRDDLGASPTTFGGARGVLRGRCRCRVLGRRAPRHGCRQGSWCPHRLDRNGAEHRRRRPRSNCCRARGVSGPAGHFQWRGERGHRAALCPPAS